MGVVMVYVTCGSMDEAKTIGRALVEERRAACVHLLPGMTSYYFWNNQLEEGAETILIAKTTDDRSAELVDRIHQLHSYEIPCIVSWPITGGGESYLRWVAEQTHVDQPEQ